MNKGAVGELPEQIAKAVTIGSQQLDKILNEDPEGKRIREIIEWNLRCDTKATTFPDLRNGLILSFGKDVGNTILNLLTTNDHKLLEMYERIGISNGVKSFLSSLLVLYGSATKRAMLCSERPNDWVFAHSIFYSDDKRGIVMRTELLKGSGEKISFDGALNDYITLAFHILKNINKAEIKLIAETEAGPKEVPLIITENFERLEKEFQKLAEEVKKPPQQKMPALEKQKLHNQKQQKKNTQPEKSQSK